MFNHKKAPTCREGLSINLQLNNINFCILSHLCINTLEVSNRLLNEKEIIDGYFSSMDFFKKREKYHQESASWYFNYQREIENKAIKEIHLAEISYLNYSHYLELIGNAYRDGFSYHKEVDHVT